ncbi:MULTISPECIES: class I SAM-dependent methyltransferase [unclassified Thioclava]|uniref:class I SAM-dependent methyltransferase n=1 Tax=unclassified Thioclava TaxID=2621713 RepID=UPI0009984DBF|nr:MULTISPECIES: class I SAM-dependent methyltransferase [unclassified Thioclava]OOY14775.1 hypothetical protein BMI85_19225 [Thioclava sp. DLFJ4-1]OOY30199.1 hypothetical protein BMI88_18735 [Thioclava sp. F36-6]
MNTLRDMNISGASISREAMMLMGFQRTRQISGTARKAWEAGDRGPALEEVEARNEEIFRGALAEVFTEYLPLRKALEETGRRPTHVIDIGCGQGLNDALLIKDYDCAVTLIDIEETPEQYHFWSDTGAGYASLDAAAAFLRDNGAHAVETLNPVKQPDALEGVTGDLVTSLISCGFHYPIGDYLDLMMRVIRDGGAVVLDLRRRYMNKPDEALSTLIEATRQTEILSYEKKARRIMFQA